MTLQIQIKKDLTAAMKARDEAKKSALRVLMGEFAREAKKELSDDDIVRIIRKLIKSEKENMEASGTSESEFIQILEHYLPKMATEDDVMSFIKENIDFSGFKNKMQAMRPIMQHFGASADGNMVKKVLQSM